MLPIIIVAVIVWYWSQSNTLANVQRYQAALNNAGPLSADPAPGGGCPTDGTIGCMVGPSSRYEGSPLQQMLAGKQKAGGEYNDLTGTLHTAASKLAFGKVLAPNLGAKTIIA